MWFWDQYTQNRSFREEITASPLQATQEQLRGLPDALIINGEADVLRDDGEAYASKLFTSGRRRDLCARSSDNTRFRDAKRFR